MDLEGELTEARVAALSDPDELIARARALQPQRRLQERERLLDRLESLLETDATALGERRRLRLELLAERAFDAGLLGRLDEASALAATVIREAGAGDQAALARALDAHARALIWQGTELSKQEGDRLLIEAAERYRALGDRESEAYAVLWRGYAVGYEQGDLLLAERLISESLAILCPDSPRLGTALDCYAYTLLELGRLDEAQDVVDRAASLPDAAQRAVPGYLEITRARLACARGDAFATERHLRDAERESGDWLQTDFGASFYADAACMLDQLGLGEQAEEYRARLDERLGRDSADCRQVRAVVLARSGEPLSALEALQGLSREAWLDKRLVWRFTLLRAWATFRAGRAGGGTLAAAACEQAIACGGIGVAVSGEPELTLAMAPLAEAEGSAAARALLLDGRELVVRLLGRPSVVRSDGRTLELPAGQAGELVRLLALHEHGLPIAEVLETFFPDVLPVAARQRLRQIRTRLRAATGEIVVRNDDTLTLLPAWVDVRAFQDAADRALSQPEPQSVQSAYAALAIWGGQPLAADRYATWAQEVRLRLEDLHLALLDLIATSAAARGSHQEALTALDAAITQDPDTPDRYAKLADQLRALGRPASADYLARRAGVSLVTSFTLGRGDEP